jgi:hypothetical protein
MEAKKKQANYRRVDCYRCGVEMSRAYVRPPALCAKCKVDIRFYERHPENADPVVWRVSKYDPNPGDKYAPKTEEQARLPLQSSERIALGGRRAAILDELEAQTNGRQHFVDKIAEYREKIDECNVRIAALREELADIEFELNRI